MTWSLVHRERATLAGDLAGLIEPQWAAGSLCDQFTVREALAHLTAGASLNPVRWMAGVLRCRFARPDQEARRRPAAVGHRRPLRDRGRAAVAGPTVALIMAMVGRSPYCDELDGDGVATLRERQGATGR